MQPYAGVFLQTLSTSVQALCQAAALVGAAIYRFNASKQDSRIFNALGQDLIIAQEPPTAVPVAQNPLEVIAAIEGVKYSALATQNVYQSMFCKK